MLIEVKRCDACSELFTFDTCQCGQIILKRGQPDSTIIFLPKCPKCGSLNTVEMPWSKYDAIDF